MPYKQVKKDLNGKINSNEKNGLVCVMCRRKLCNYCDLFNFQSIYFLYCASNGLTINRLAINRHTTNDVHTNSNWDILKAHLNNIIRTHIPSRKSSGKPELPWLGSKLRRAIRRKNKLYCKARRSKNDQQWQHYRQAKRDVQRALHHAERNYIDNILGAGGGPSW